MPEQTTNQLADQLMRQYYATNSYGKASIHHTQPGVNAAHALAGSNQKLLTQGYANLYSMLRSQGRMDPRILARQQALNSRSTQQQKDAARADAARRGLSGGGVNQAIQAAIGSAGANRAADFNYRDIADSYARNQQNLGILQQLVSAPSIDYAALGSNQYNADRNSKNQQNAGYAAALASIVGAIACRVAKELYGEDSPKFKSARAYVVAKVPMDTSLRYILHGEELAARVRSDPKFREEVTPIFERLAERGAAMEHGYA